MYTDFEFANRRLSDFGCIMCNIGSDSGLRDVDIGNDITFNTVKNNQSSLHKNTSSTYGSVYSVTFDIIKNPCGNDKENVIMSLDETRNIVKWLNRRDYYKFKMYGNDPTIMSLIYFGSFNVKQKMIGSEIIGLSVTFTSNSPYALSEKKTVGFNVSEENQKIYLFGDGDEYGNIYPVVKILFKKACDEFTITNHNTSTTVYLRNCKEGEMITIDGEHKIITTDNDTHKKTLYNDFNYEYLNIFIDENDYNENEYEVSSPCLITIEYYPVRKVGVY